MSCLLRCPNVRAVLIDEGVPRYIDNSPSQPDKQIRVRIIIIGNVVCCRRHCSAADAQPHNETDRMRDSSAEASINPHSNEPDTPSFFYNAIAPPLHNERQQAVAIWVTRLEGSPLTRDCTYVNTYVLYMCSA